MQLAQLIFDPFLILLGVCGMRLFTTNDQIRFANAHFRQYIYSNFHPKVSFEFVHRLEPIRVNLSVQRVIFLCFQNRVGLLRQAHFHVLSAKRPPRQNHRHTAEHINYPSSQLKQCFEYQSHLYVLLIKHPVHRDRQHRVEHHYLPQTADGQCYPP